MRNTIMLKLGLGRVSRESYIWIGWVGIASGRVSGRVGY